jgi:quercetin dioxygenase-like cupin family protein/DNA-binding Xre family transcriptional regulator
VSSALQPSRGSFGAPASLADGLRALRRSRGLSLAEVGDATGISPSFLSLVEKGKSDITLGRLVRLVEFYGVTINDLLPGPPEAAFPDVVRLSERRVVQSPAEGIDVYLLSGDTRRTMMPHLLEFKPGARLAERGHHEGEEWVHVLEGTLSLELQGCEPELLKAGDSGYYPADQPHMFRNASDTEPLRLICVDSPPNL